MRIGLVGVGRWGANWLPLLASHPEVELTGICDSNPLVLQALSARSRLGASGSPVGALPSTVRMFSHVAGLLGSGVEAVVLATPAETHVELAVLALSAGAHVLVEKPLATTVEGAEGVVQAAARSRRVCAVGHSTLHHEALSRRSGTLRSIGRVRRVVAKRTSRGAEHSDESAIFGLAAHDVATLLGPLGLRARSVRARSLSVDRPDQAVVLDVVLDASTASRSRSRASDVVLAEITVSRLGPGRVRTVDVVGERGTFMFDELANEPPGGALQRQCDVFVSRILAGDVSTREPRLAADVVRVLVAAQTSLRAGGVFIDLDERGGAGRPEEQDDQGIAPRTSVFLSS